MALTLAHASDPGQRCGSCIVRTSSLCGSLDQHTLGALAAIGQRHRLVRGETLLWAGEDSPLCYNLLSGMLKLTATAADGREQIVGLHYPSDFVGRPYADTANFTVTALTDATLCAFPRKMFEQALESHAALEHQLLRRTFAALDEARSRMLMLARQSAEERIAAFLLEMADRGETNACRACADGPVTFDLPLSRGAIADVLGLTIETVSRQMTRLKVAGVIALPGGRAITIRDHAALERRAGLLPPPPPGYIGSQRAVAA